MQALLDARPPRNVFRMLAHAPGYMPGLMKLTGAILYASKLPPRLRELAVLRVGYLCGSHYEVRQHHRIAAAIGLSEAQIAGTAHDADATLYSGEELLVLRMAEQLVRRVKADDDLFAATVAALGAEQTMELMVIIGVYVMLAQVLENTGVQLEAGSGPSQEDVTAIFRRQAAGS
ncbi:MAG: carboxymuconolactone decarboxylase family protein [Lautropia sp.]